MIPVKPAKARKKRAKDLRRRAEQSVRGLTPDLRGVPKPDVVELIHELQVHQVELELQNDELRRTQSEVEASRQKYADLFDFAPVGYLTLERNGRVREANLGAARLLGIDGRSLLKRALDRSVGRDFRAAFQDFLRRVFASTAEQSCEIQLTRNNGGVIDAQLIAKAIVDSEGASMVCHTAVVDISERKRAEQALVTAHGELEEKVRERTAELAQINANLQESYGAIKVLHEISQSILNFGELDDVLTAILDKSLGISGAEIGDIYLRDNHRPIIALAASRGHRDNAIARQRYYDLNDAASGRITRKVLQSKQTQVVEDGSSAEGLRTFKSDGARSLIAFPVCANEAVLGVVILASRSPRQFNSSLTAILEGLGNLMGLAVQKARLNEQSQSQLQRLSSLHEIDLAINSSLRLDTVLALLVEKLCSFYPDSAAIVSLYKEQRDDFEYSACRNLNLEMWKSHQVGRRKDRGLTRLVFDSRSPVAIADLRNDPRVADPGFLLEQGLASCCLMPLMVKERFLGTLGLYTRQLCEWPKGELEFLATVAGAAAMAVYNAQLYEEVVAGRALLEGLSHRLLGGQETERRQIVRELYDEVVQELTALRLNLEMAERERGHESRQQSLKTLRRSLEDMVTRIVNLSLELRPPILDDFGILAALGWYLNRHAARTGTPVDFHHSGVDRRFSPALETAAYRIVQEMLNHAEHDEAVKDCALQLRATQETLYVGVQFHGAGFNSDDASSARLRDVVAELRERAMLVGGRLVVTSMVGRGMDISAELPIVQGEQERSSQGDPPQIPGKIV